MKFQVLFTILILATAAQGLFLKTALKKKLLNALITAGVGASGSGDSNGSASEAEAAAGAGSTPGSGPATEMGTTPASTSVSTESPSSTTTEDSVVVVPPGGEEAPGVEVSQRVVYFATPVVYRQIRPVAQKTVSAPKESNPLGHLKASVGNLMSVIG